MKGRRRKTKWLVGAVMIVTTATVSLIADGDVDTEARGGDFPMIRQASPLLVDQSEERAMKEPLKAVTRVLVCAAIAANASGLPYQSTGGSTDMPIAAAEASPAQVQQLVAPIALYPDELVAQVLAAATYPDQIVEADRWLQAHSSLQGDARAREIDNENWDPAVKAMTAFPSVLANMDKNLSWTSSLGDAYISQPQAVTDAVQTLRHRAQQSGNLETNAQQTVSTQGKAIAIEPASPDIVYVPQFDPWIVYGAPLVAWPGWYGYPGLFWDGPGVAFGLGFGIGFFGGYGWGWHHWGFDWRHHDLAYDHHAWASHSHIFANRHVLAARGDHAFAADGHAVGTRGAGGHGAPHVGRSPAFGGFTRGGDAHGFGARGRASFGGGFHGGGRR